jgi:hypothetical protein
LFNVIRISMVLQSWKCWIISCSEMSCKEDGKEYLDMTSGYEENVKLTQPRQQTTRFKTLSFSVRSMNTK